MEMLHFHLDGMWRGHHVGWTVRTMRSMRWTMRSVSWWRHTRPHTLWSHIWWHTRSHTFWSHRSRWHTWPHTLRSHGSGRTRRWHSSWTILHARVWRHTWMRWSRWHSRVHARPIMHWVIGWHVLWVRTSLTMRMWRNWTVGTTWTRGTTWTIGTTLTANWGTMWRSLLWRTMRSKGTLTRCTSRWTSGWTRCRCRSSRCGGG